MGLFQPYMQDGAAAGSSVDVIAPADAESTAVRHVVQVWRKWCGFSAMPARAKLSPRDLGRTLSNISLARVIAGSDYEFAIIGDKHVQAYGHSYQGRRLSEVIAAAPRFGRQLQASYDYVRMTGRPLGFRGMIGHDVPDARFEWFETMYLPLGSQAEGVDHVLNVATYSLAPTVALSPHRPEQRERYLDRV
jgi:hypothetical protein